MGQEELNPTDRSVFLVFHHLVSHTCAEKGQGSPFCLIGHEGRRSASPQAGKHGASRFCVRPASTQFMPRAGRDRYSGSVRERLLDTAAWETSPEARNDSNIEGEKMADGLQLA